MLIMIGGMRRGRVGVCTEWVGGSWHDNIALRGVMGSVAFSTW